MTEKKKAMSANDAKKIKRRVAPVRSIAEPAIYSVVEPITGQRYTGRLAVMQALCPKVKPSTLKQRLESGERDLMKLRRKPDTRGRRKM